MVEFCEFSGGTVELRANGQLRVRCPVCGRSVKTRRQEHTLSKPVFATVPRHKKRKT